MYPDTSGDGAECPVTTGLTGAAQLQPQIPPASKNAASTPARINNDKVHFGCKGIPRQQVHIMHKETNLSVPSLGIHLSFLFRYLQISSWPNSFLLFQDKRAAWFDLFADLDPLADPDAVGRTVPGAEDRNC